MIRFLRHVQTQQTTNNLLSSKLFDQSSFYHTFLGDVNNARSLVLVESPFITMKRLDTLLPTLRQLVRRQVKVFVNTKPPHEQDAELKAQARQGIAALQSIGATVLVTGGHHRKLAIIDGTVLWEGSLNILSQNDSCEVMRRIYSEQAVNQMLAFLKLDIFLR